MTIRAFPKYNLGRRNYRKCRRASTTSWRSFRTSWPGQPPVRADLHPGAGEVPARQATAKRD